MGCLKKMNEQRLVPRIKFKAFKDAWKKEKLGNLSDIVRGASPRPIEDKKWFSKDSNIGWLRISDVTEQNGKIYHLEQKISPLGQEKTRVVKSKHLLLSIAATVGSPVINYIPTGVHDGFLIFLNPQFNIDFMFQWLTNYKSNWAKYGQPGSQVNLNSKIVKNQRIYIPGLKEQQKIGDLFAKLDRLLDLQQQKLDQLELLKKALLQKLFPKQGAKIPELRFKGFEEEWKQEQFSDLYKKRSEKNDLTFGPDKIISVANMYFKQTETRSDEEYMKTYNIFLLGDIAFEGNKSKRFSFGRFVENTIGDGIVSHVFEVFKPTASYDLNYWKYAIHNEDFMGPILRRSTIKATMMSNLITKDFLKQKITVPKLSEQQKIGNLFAKIDRLIELENKKLHNLKLVKKSLLQNMFVE